MLLEEKRCQTNVAPDPNSRSCSLATVWAGELGVMRRINNKVKYARGDFSMDGGKKPVRARRV